MSKRRMQERKTGEEERVVAKSKPTMSLVSKTSNRSPTLDAGVFNSPENFGMQNQSSDLSGIGKPMSKTMNRLTEPSLTHHTFEIVNVPHLEKASANARQKFSRQEFKSATTKTAMHLGPDCEQKSVHCHEHRLRAAQNIIRYLGKFDPESKK